MEAPLERLERWLNKQLDLNTEDWVTNNWAGNEDNNEYLDGMMAAYQKTLTKAQEIKGNQ